MGREDEKKQNPRAVFLYCTQISGLRLSGLQVKMFF